MTAPEFSRPQRLDAIGAGALRVVIAANAAERVKLAGRFGLISVDTLDAEFSVLRDETSVIARGTLTGAVVQPCSVTGGPVPAKVKEKFTIRFLLEGSPDADEMELTGDDCDTIFYTGGTIDLGEAAAETLALALEPFPRSAGAEAFLRDAGVLNEDETGPFAALAKLRQPKD